jgi:hypothetical protein
VDGCTLCGYRCSDPVIGSVTKRHVFDGAISATEAGIFRVGTVNRSAELSSSNKRPRNVVSVMEARS